MKWMKILALLLCLCLLTGCVPVGIQRTTATLSPETVHKLPDAVPDQATEKEALLYFRYLNEPYLAAESREVSHSPAEPYELALAKALLSGPTPQQAELTSLFPAGVQVLSTARQGRTLFVTLSQEIMNRYPDESHGWQQQPEAALRRRLCMQSLVATLTENCDVDQVQVLVEQSRGDMGSLRLKQSYFLTTTDEMLLTSPMTREEALLLTPGNALRVILDLWQQRDWQRLYLYIAAADPMTGAEKRNYADFVTMMENLPNLLAADYAGGSVSADGRFSTYTVTARLLTGGHQQEHTATLRLLRENGLWKITLAQLTDWLEVVR